MSKLFDLPLLKPAELRRLQHDAEDIAATAKRKNLTLDQWELREESAMVRQHFALGCWLYYYSTRNHLPGPQ